MMTYLPLLMECPNCEKIFARGRVGKGRSLNIRYKCPNCGKYVKIWDVRKFFKSIKTGYNNAKLVEVDYKSLKPTIEFIKSRHEDRVARLVEKRKQDREKND